MFYQEALPKFRFLSCVDSLLTIGDIHWRKVATMFEKAESANLLLFVVRFHMGAYFCMGAYKHDVVVVIKMGAYIHGVLILCGCLLSRFYGMVLHSSNFYMLQNLRSYMHIYQEPVNVCSSTLCCAYIHEGAVFYTSFGLVFHTQVCIPVHFL